MESRGEHRLRAPRKHLNTVKLLIVDELGYLPFAAVGSVRLAGALLDGLTHHVHILEMNGDSYRLADSKKAERRSAQGRSQNSKTPSEGDPATEL